jgi:hypothetical protein
MSHAILDAVHDKIPAVTGIALRYPRVLRWDDWWIPEGTVPEAVPHDIAARHLQDVLNAWVKRTGRPAFVARNLAIRYLKQRPNIGIDPDLCVLEPEPEDVTRLPSLCLWKDGHVRPPLCIEVVSSTHPNKDYGSIHERYAAMDAAEVAVFDPLLIGPKSLGGPVPLQLWRRDDTGIFERVHFGAEPAFCRYLQAWFIPNDLTLEVADDAHGEHLWPTEVQMEAIEKERERAEKERERAEKERERAEKERERAARLDVERRLAQLEEQVRAADKK